MSAAGRTEAAQTAFGVNKRATVSGLGDLAWVIVQWAKSVRPKVIALENVGEFPGQAMLFMTCLMTTRKTKTGSRPDLTHSNR